MNDDESNDAALSTTALQPLTVALLESITPAQVALAVVERGIAVLDADAGLVAVVNEEGNALELVQAQGYKNELASEWARFSLDGNLPLSNAVREMKPFFISTFAEWATLYPHLVEKRTGRTNATVDLPLLEGSRRLGGLHFSFAEERGFTAADRAFLAELARQCALALSRAISLAASVEAHARQEFLVRASEVLAASLDYEQTLENLTRLIVPELADAAQVHLVSEKNGGIIRVAVAHRRPEMEDVARELYARYPIETTPGSSTLNAIHTGKTQFIPNITDELLEKSAIDSEHHRLIVLLDLRSTLTIPLIARGATLGAITFVMTRDSNRRFSSSTVRNLEELARRAAIAVDNSRLYADAQREIDERRLAEQALRESELRKSTIMAAALDCIITIDAEEHVLEWNAAAEQTFGYSRDQALGRNLSEMIIPSRLRGAHTRGIARYLSTGEGPALFKRLEVPALHADGTEFPAELTALPIILEGRTLFTAYLRDITDRKQSEEALKEAVARQRSLLRDVLASVTEGKLHLLDSPDLLPRSFDPVGGSILLSVTDGLKELRERARSAAASAGHTLERQYDLLTAASEAAMNAVVHAGGGQASVSVHSNGAVQVRVTDCGAGIALENLPQATLARGFSTKATLGHGLKMMLETADRLYLLTGPTGTTVVLEQDMSKPMPAWLSE